MPGDPRWSAPGSADFTHGRAPRYRIATLAHFDGVVRDRPYADLSLGLVPTDSTVSRYRLEVRKASERATMLTRRLLTFSRKQIIQPEQLDVGAALGDLENMLRRLIREDITLTMSLESTPDRVLVDRGHVEQVAMSLVVNARDAIEGSGAISISTRSVVRETGASPDPDVSGGRYVVLTVADDGAGMTDDNKAHLFEAFFTTKPEGEGTGLGLATVHGIVEQAGAHIRCVSAPGVGPTFRVYWPAVDLPVVRAGIAAPAAEPGRGSETVLVAEDDPIVREVLVEVLCSRGYDVLEASDGAVALEKAHAHQGPIHALVTDVVMPGMHGPDLADRIRAARPRIRVMLLSAYATELADGVDVARLEATFLPKPFRIDEFLAKLRDMLRP